MSGRVSGVPAPQEESAELQRLRNIEEAARWHLAHSACAGWPQGEALALALGVDPEGPQHGFNRLLRALGFDAQDDPLSEITAEPPAEQDG